MCLTVDKVTPSSDALTNQQTERRQIAQLANDSFFILLYTASTITTPMTAP